MPAMTDNERQAEIQKRIYECRRTRSTELDLRGLIIDEVPEDVFELVWLESLDISGDWDGNGQLVCVPSQLQYLNKLKKLHCSFHKISNLNSLKYIRKLIFLNCSFNKLNTLQDVQYLLKLKFLFCFGNQLINLKGLESLFYLQILECEDNQISTLQGLSCLTDLKKLDCSDNRLSTLQGLEHVLQLQTLNCSWNQLITLQGLERLSRLRTLDCSNNNLVRIPQVIQQRVFNKKIVELNLDGNHLKNIPQVVYENNNCCEPLINYWQALSKGSTYVQQLKVQLIGNGRVGKTTLAYALEHKKAPPENFESTHGIALKEIPFQLEGQDQPVTLQLWDFGGQEIYHATHRLFLAKDCLYLLLWAEETEESLEETNHPVSYWLELIHDLGGDSPVILVKNQIDRSDKLPERPEGLTNDLSGAKQVRDAVKVSAMKYQRIPSLRGAIASIIEELQPRICLELPNSWLAVQAELDTLRSQQQRTLHFDEFEKFCEQAGIEDAQWFADYLHQSGFIFYQANSFQNQLILDQNWAIETIYKLFDRNKSIRRRIEKAQGRISGDEFAEFWPTETESEHQIYASFMRNCGVCYEIDWNSKKHFKDREFIIPALLPEKSPLCESWGTERAGDWQLEVQYPFLHRSIIERLIAKLDQKYRGSTWRSGIFCTTSDGQVLMQTQLEQAKTSNKGSLLFKLRGQQLERLLYELRRLISQASPHKHYQELLTRYGKTEPLPEFQEEYHMTESTPVEVKKVKIFISYSHEDEDKRQELDKRLKAIQRLLPIETWHDRQLLAGERVHEKILKQLEGADIVILLISSSFIASDYCFSKEMEVALKAYEKNENVVIPIIVSETADWHDFDIGKITALPTDGKPPNQWIDKDAFWADVQKGIKRQVEHLLNKAD